MCKIIETSPAEYECLTHYKTFHSARAVPSQCPTARKFAKDGAPALPAKYAALESVLHTDLAGRSNEILAGSRVSVFGGRTQVNGTLIGAYARGTGAFAGEMAVILREDTNEYAEYWTGPSMGRSYGVVARK